MANYNNLRSKLNRAIAAYLVSQACGSVDDISPANSRTASKYPNTKIRCTIGKPEVPLTGLRRMPVLISIRGSATQKPGEPNPDLARVNFDARVAATYDAMLQSDDDQTFRATARAITATGRALAVVVDPNDPESVQFAANNADMVDFTCQAVYDTGEGDGEPDAEGCDWHEILTFEVLCSPSNVD